MAERMGGNLYQIHYLRFKDPLHAPAKYVLQTAKTWSVLVRERPDAVFVQNPPIFCVQVVDMYCRLSGARFIIDSHTGAFLSPRWRWALPVHRFLSRRALSTLVTNEYLSRLVKGWGAPSLVIRDVPAALGQGRPFPVKDGFVITVVNSFSWDEPLEEVLEAAHGLPGIVFYVTGNPNARERAFQLKPPGNVSFTGFLPDEDYIGLLRASHAIMALTTRDHTMQRGACEALSLGKPVITSDWEMLREYFSRGTVYVKPSPQSIRDGILEMRRKWQSKIEEIQELKEEREEEWQQKKSTLLALLEDVR